MLAPVVADCNHNNAIGQGLGGEMLGFRALKAAGCVGVILKARQGVGFGDPAFARRRDLGRNAGLKVGAYDFATHDDVAENVKDFLAFTGIDPDLSYWLDFEDNRASQMSGEQAFQFLDHVSQVIGRPCGIYGGNRIVEQISNSYLDPNDADEVANWRRHPLWLCQYKTAPALRNADLAALKPHIRIPPPWESWFLLQYTGDGVGPLPHTMPGLESGADLNVFDGTAAALAAAWIA